MKSLLNIPLGRQIQLAVLVFMILPATLTYGPGDRWFQGADMALRDLMRPSVAVAEHYHALAIDVPQLQDGTP
ncbi:MAG: hypothetical protein AAGA84_10930, partial [Pseudomonadota bacterium]